MKKDFFYQVVVPISIFLIVIQVFLLMSIVGYRKGEKDKDKQIVECIQNEPDFLTKSNISVVDNSEECIEFFKTVRTKLRKPKN